MLYISALLPSLEGGVPAIVSTELFNKVQDRLRDNHNKIRNHNGKNYYPMNGRVFCGKCGKPLNGKVQYSKTNKNNEPTKQYRFSCDCCMADRNEYENDTPGIQSIY